MAKHKKVESLFVGKTITKIDTSACNCWHFHFTDGSIAAIEVESVRPSIGLYGMTAAQSTDRLT